MVVFLVKIFGAGFGSKSGGFWFRTVDNTEKNQKPIKTASTVYTLSNSSRRFWEKHKESKIGNSMCEKLNLKHSFAK